MNIQIYIAHRDDVQICLAVGVDLVGVVADPLKHTPSSLDFEEVRRVFSLIPDGVKKIALSMESSSEAFLRTVEAVKPDVLHIACSLSKLSVEQLLTLKPKMGETELMLAVSMNAQEPVENAKKFDQVVDYFILDTSDPERVDIGATGKVHDWDLSARLVENVSRPVVLAGGLSAHNVAEAIQIVKPWGVDSFSHTNFEGLVRKDPSKVSAFVKAATLPVKDNNAA